MLIVYVIPFLPVQNHRSRSFEPWSVHHAGDDDSSIPAEEAAGVSDLNRRQVFHFLEAVVFFVRFRETYMIEK